MTQVLHIVGGGMAGSEAAWQAAEMGVDVVIHEMRPTVGTFAHQTGNLAEMVCSNSFRSDDDEQNAVGPAALGNAGGKWFDHDNSRCAPPARRWCPGRGSRSLRRKPSPQNCHAHPRVSVTDEEVTTLPDEGPMDLSQPGL